MKIATYNVNGIRARMPLLQAWLKKEAPDILCLQETKVIDELFPKEAFQDLGYECSFRGEKSFNGVAILSKKRPDEVVYGFRDFLPKDESRFIAAKFDSVWILNTYVPQGQDIEKEQFQYKLEWLHRFLKEVKKWFLPSDRLLWMGDINIALTAKDVYAPETMAGGVGFHPQEQKRLLECEVWGFTDLFRKFHPEDVAYTFWDYRIPNGFKRNMGWRLDYIWATDALAKEAKTCQPQAYMRTEEKPSDHVPVVATFTTSI